MSGRTILWVGSLRSVVMSCVRRMARRAAGCRVGRVAPRAAASTASPPCLAAGFELELLGNIPQRRRCARPERPELHRVLERADDHARAGRAALHEPARHRRVKRWWSGNAAASRRRRLPRAATRRCSGSPMPATRYTRLPCERVQRPLRRPTPRDAARPARVTRPRPAVRPLTRPSSATTGATASAEAALARDHDHRRARERAERLAPRACRKQPQRHVPAIGADQHDVGVAARAAVLKRVVQDGDIGAQRARRWRRRRRGRPAMTTGICGLSSPVHERLVASVAAHARWPASHRARRAEPRARRRPASCRCRQP